MGDSLELNKQTDFKRTVLITDGLIGVKDDPLVQITLAKRALIKDVVDIIKSEVKNKVSENFTFFVSVGSYNVTAKGCGWHLNYKNKESRMVTAMATRFQRELDSLKALSNELKCKIILFDLIPLPEQDFDNVPPTKQKLASALSELFVGINNQIKLFSRCPIFLCRFVSQGGKRKYRSGQYKLKTQCYCDDSLTKDTQATMLESVLDAIKKSL